MSKRNFGFEQITMIDTEDKELHTAYYVSINEDGDGASLEEVEEFSRLLQEFIKQVKKEER